MSDPGPDLHEVETSVAVDGAELDATLALPKRAPGIVLFVHGSGSGRDSPRNRLVAAALQRRGLATLLVDLLTRREAEVDTRTGELRFDIALLARRVSGALDWLEAQPATAGLEAGLFGASTGAAAALMIAAERPDDVAAVVSRGGRPDLAGDRLDTVRAPTLLIVGGADQEVLRLNEEALDRLPGERRLEVVPDAGHLFEEPGSLEQVAELAGKWFAPRLGAGEPAG